MKYSPDFSMNLQNKQKGIELHMIQKASAPIGTNQMKYEIWMKITHHQSSGC